MLPRSGHVPDVGIMGSERCTGISALYQTVTVGILLIYLHQQCPVNLQISEPRPSIGSDYRVIYFCADLKSVYPYSGSSNFQRSIQVLCASTIVPMQQGQTL